ncbi:MAG: aminotransferase class V-fold PLP-dependent enzyme [Blautia sp.]|nr:aminotransferase class V-fold PLP-dependent enzyme [Blautia sp.]
MMPFASDYMEGAHEKILSKLQEMNHIPQIGYGADEICEAAKEKIRKACGCPEAEIFFTVGGTQTNTIVIDSMLQNYEGVISAATGHINCHESGAIEFTGHKVITVPGYEGKLRGEDIEKTLETFWSDGTFEHMVFPGMVYISFPTEYGTIYSEEELKEISAVCGKYNIPLFADGARLGYALASDRCDITLEKLAEYCDVFYIGGTKVGALFGEAVVFTKRNMPKHFLTHVKQHGGLLAKGWLLGLQFDVLFTDNLYMEIAEHAILMAKYMRAELEKRGCRIFLDSPTNQQFLILENRKLKELDGKVAYSVWEKFDDTHTVVRFATSWATRREDIDALLTYF